MTSIMQLHNDQIGVAHSGAVGVQFARVDDDM